MKPQTFRIFGIVLAVIAFFISIVAIYNKSWMIGGAGMLICLVLFIFAFKINPEMQQIPFQQVLKEYKKQMEEDFHISFPNDVKIEHLDEINTDYVAVISYLNKDDEKTLYFPFECDMFTLEFGRGFGQFFNDRREMEFWIAKNTKTSNPSEVVAKKMGEQIAKSIQDELEFRRRQYGEGEEQVETSGG